MTLRLINCSAQQNKVWCTWAADKRLFTQWWIFCSSRARELRNLLSQRANFNYLFQFIKISRARSKSLIYVPYWLLLDRLRTSSLDVCSEPFLTFSSPSELFSGESREKTRSRFPSDKSTDMNQQCKVCGEPAAGFHFGAFTCEGCKVSSWVFITFARLYNLRFH